MDDNMKKIQENLIEIEAEAEAEAEHLLLARHQMVENDKLRNGNREALTALRKRARTTKTSVPSPFESVMKEIEGMRSKPLVREVCATCGNHDSTEKTWMMFVGTDIFARIPFHAAHTILEKGDSQSIKVQQKDNVEREKGDIVMSTISQTRDNREDKIDSLNNETVVIDPKRRRLDEDGENTGLDSRPKNLQLAGPGFQARPSS
ncbi:p53 and DNA damage-regulated protein 1 [Heracleum sosnowskyi]|uniref:P53 and DNA damage-regulated protein 1 n=1 Tax=Heracleum sosnowskyi TaxID=360622 RepID=A0AAD8I2M1_9APIA|nr:p53 and DNA damage-regulated protein 1 [Heracleum sosnowskyi]